MSADTDSQQATARIESPDGRSFALRGAEPDSPRVGDYLDITSGATSLIVESVELDGPEPGGSKPGYRASGSVLHIRGEVPIRGAATSRPAGADVIAELVTGPSEQLHLGRLVLNPTVEVSLVAKKLNRHTFWCGQSGSGKTYALGVALERILSGTRLPIVVFDPNSDFVSLNQVSAEATADDAGDLERREMVILRPDDEHFPLRVRFADLSPRSKAAVLRLDPVTDRAEYNALIRLSASVSGDDANEIVPHLRSLGDPDAEALAQRIENLGLTEWSKTWARGATAATDVIGRRPAATVLDLGGYDRHEEQLTIALCVLDDLWARRVERRPVLLVLDEAHNLCPPAPDTPLGIAVRDRLIQIAAEGRKFGLWLLVSTQRPSKVHAGIVSQCDNLTLMRMNSRADLDELAQIFSFIPSDLMRQAAQFQLGEALVAGGFVAEPSVIRIRARVTVEGGKDVPVPLA